MKARVEISDTGDVQQRWRLAAPGTRSLALTHRDVARGRSVLRAAALLVISALLPAAAALAAGDPNAAKGLIVEHCLSCHDIPGYQSSQPAPALGMPSFQAFADDPDRYTEERLRRFLRRPHWPMTQFRLSKSDIDNILAFIESLRRD